MFCALGGCNEVGMNAYAYGYDDDWILVDLGLGFISDPQLQGVELKIISPDLLIENRDLIKAVFITHAHEDHIGGMRLLSDYLAKDCPIHATGFARRYLRQKFVDERRKILQPLRDLPLNKSVQVGGFLVSSFSVRHSIPQSRGLTIRVPEGLVLHSGDWKRDTSAKIAYTCTEKPISFLKARLKFADTPLLAFVSESTNAADHEDPPQESRLYDALVEEFECAPARLLTTTFASDLQRLCTLMKAGQAVGRQTCFIGRSLWRVWDCASNEGLVDDVIQPIAENVALGLARNRVLFIVTGCQGEPRAVLTRIARRNFNKLYLEPEDTVVYSSSVIPGNEYVIYSIENALSQQGVRIKRHANFHVSGHAVRNDIAQAYQELEPDLVIPIHGEPRHLMQNALLADEHDSTQITIPENGTCIALNGARKGQIVDTLDAYPVYLDGGTMVSSQATRLLRRQRMARDGEAIISVIFDSWPLHRDQIGLSLVGLVDDDSPAAGEPILIAECRDLLTKACQSFPSKPRHSDLAVQLRRETRRFLFAETEKRPEVTIHLYHDNIWHCYPRAL